MKVPHKGIGVVVLAGIRRRVSHRRSGTQGCIWSLTQAPCDCVKGFYVVQDLIFKRFRGPGIGSLD